MVAVRRLLVLPILVGAIVAFSAFAAAPTPAQADNCQAEQLPPLNQPPLMPEESDPRCIVLKAAGCPNVVDQAACIAGITDATRTRLFGPRPASCDYIFRPQQLLNYVAWCFLAS